MSYAFSEEFDRLGTNCVKWEFIPEEDKLVYGDHAHTKQGDQRMLPLWVADMDFRSPPAVIDALVARAEHGAFGYSSPTDPYFEAVIGWLARRHGWQVEREWITVTPGVVPSLNMMIQAFVAPGEKVLVQRPVYHPFFAAIENNGAEIVSNTLRYVNGRYEMDFDDLAVKVADPAVKVAILCSPHNPIGRVWTKDELTQFGEICLANDVLVISDEIHGDLIYPGQWFTSFATISDEFERKSIACTAASKTFNLPGLKTSNIITADPELKSKFDKVILRNGLFGANAFGLVATQAAYNHCVGWLESVMDYVAENYQFMVDFISEQLPQLKVIKPEGTYLVWVDFSALGLAPKERKRLMREEARVLLDEGELFGPEGAQFERFNIACPRSILEEALLRITRIVEHADPEVAYG